VRTRLLVAFAALIAAVALVAQPGPAGSTEPGTDRSIDPSALRRLALPRPIDGAAASPTLDPRAASAFVLDDSVDFREPGSPPLPTSRPDLDQPDGRLGIVVRPTPTPRPTPRPATATTRSTGGSWIYDPEASWYGPGFYGKRTACGHAYTTTIQGVAHRSLPCGTRVTFRNPKNGRTITVPVIDRGPYVDGRIWDLSGATCTYLDHCYTGPIQWRYP
jgi:hypothetical protein